MRAALVIASIVAPAAIAHADAAADVRAIVQHHVAALGGKDAAAIRKDFTATAIVSVPWVSQLAPVPAKDPWTLEGTDTAAYTIRNLAVGIDVAHHTGWFHVVVDGKVGARDAQFRANGIVVDDHGWKFSYVMYGKPLDKVHPDYSTGHVLEIANHRAPSVQIADWFVAGIGSDLAAGAVASGFDPEAFAEGADTSALVDKFTKRKMYVKSVYLPVLDDAIGTALVECELTAGGSMVIAYMSIIVVREGTRWKLASIHPLHF